MRSMAERIKEATPTVADIYFNNHWAGFGPTSANTFREMLGLEPVTWDGLSTDAAETSGEARLDY
jgi:hypothetical protein